MKTTHIIIHYSEIGIKKDNRFIFENKLLKNISNVCRPQIQNVFKRYGRLIIVLKEDSNLSIIKKNLENTPGISSFSFCYSCSQDILEIKKLVFDIAKSKENDFVNFRVTTKRSFKKFPLTSQEADAEFGADVFMKLKKPVKLKNSDLDIGVEITEKEVFVYTNKDSYKSIGGLPVGSTGNVVCSLSGGIDSPVSGYMLNKRGCKVVYVHIQSNNLVTKEVEDKIFKLCSILKDYQGDTKLIVVPFSDIQKQLLIAVPADYRMIIYRRFMFRIINKIADKENALGIVTGDSVGQVASQTLENLNCIYEAAKFPVFSPLIGLNKDEIIAIAQKIGTYETSILPYPDCCSFMVAEHPKTKGSIADVKYIENNIKDIDLLVDDAISKSNNYYFK
jgi:tRNA uracil 4-sulfurtransferase